MSIENLLKLNVNEHTEKKNGLTYLSWAWAWAEILKADPKATYKVEMFGDKCFMEINGTAMVWVTVTVFDKPMTCQLPVMNHRNQAIQAPDAFQVNTAIMRCLTKALSLHGLGLYIYAGEDVPEDDDSPSFRGKNPLDKIADTTARPKAVSAYPLRLPQQEEPVSVHQSSDAWVDAYAALMKRVEDSAKIPDPRDKMTKLREIKEANEAVLDKLDVGLKAKVTSDYQLRIRRLGAQQDK